MITISIHHARVPIQVKHVKGRFVIHWLPQCKWAHFIGRVLYGMVYNHSSRFVGHLVSDWDNSSDVSIDYKCSQTRCVYNTLCMLVLGPPNSPCYIVMTQCKDNLWPLLHKKASIMKRINNYTLIGWHQHQHQAECALFGVNGFHTGRWNHQSYSCLASSGMKSSWQLHQRAPVSKSAANLMYCVLASASTHPHITQWHPHKCTHTHTHTHCMGIQKKPVHDPSVYTFWHLYCYTRVIILWWNLYYHTVQYW